ncbi:MAG: hypothetical protein COU29_00135 [Candidatus Magasanikbacteria bacterium CG10_big_fil_rev_8_21_14_0_10_36_32]|uniref:TVP38/TMEM64 family membrane protein n=1 Tax=Candidatus Magasanikbacteria bacterium CG10_big_fil_rev_8_21_14_0_10_36_32 TaxID=1974646 RepID=A0A2M6W7N8_9BACT|nr:MAG: hypothetical protein COU29_00135 [Candidatus Magasanikbacteria bacterium CG10_big_fil_rev_8_21_14_0_10_36_32]
MNNILKKIKYPKFFLLIIVFIITYFIFMEGSVTAAVQEPLLYLGYFGALLAGILYVYGFTAAPAVAILLILSARYNIWLIGFIAGVGAAIGDSLIFRFVRRSFADEIAKLFEEKIMILLRNKTPYLIKKYLTSVLAVIIIASPLPDEIGVSLLAASQSISTKLFTILSYTLNTAGIFIILLIGHLM